MDNQQLEQGAKRLLSQFDPDRDRQQRFDRPFIIELFGTPKAGKTTVAGMIKHFFRRGGWSVSTPVEGAEYVELPRDEPAYNFQTCEYALGMARDRVYNRRFHLVILDRGIFDGVVRMEYYRRKGVMTPAQAQVAEDYYLLPWNRDLFDLNICLVSAPEVAIKRELARAITKKDGKTMNPQTLQGLLAAHQAVWDRLGCNQDPRMFWHDSTSENELETASLILTACLTAFDRRLTAMR